MDSVIIVLIISVLVALAFDVINGFHDSANTIATIVATRVLHPKFAVIWAASFNFLAIFVFAPRVADTVSKIIDINPQDPAFLYVVLSALLGAITWDLITWWLGLPTSSSHALIGGLTGAGIAHMGTSIINWDKLSETMAFIPLAPVIGAVIGFIVMIAVYWIFRKWKPSKVDTVFRKGQLLSAAMYALGHGGNDAQKTMGIIMALFIAAGVFDKNTKLSLMDWKTSWIILSCQLALAIGISLGGWRIVKTMGMKLTKLKPVHGFCAETAGALTIFLATHLGIPVSTTHTISGAIIGVGSTTNFSGIKWVIATKIVMSWVITIPVSAIFSTIVFYIFKLISPSF
jgi:inorganic phosphate transporter, PiT family